MKTQNLLTVLVVISLLSLSSVSVKSQEVEYDYRGPRIDEVILSVMPEAESQMLALETGEIDQLGWPGVPPAHVTKLMANPNIKLVTSADMAYYPLVFNCRKHPFNITEFRHAIAYMIDREEIVNVLLMGYGNVARSCLSSGHGVWFNPNTKQYDFNLTKAAEILDSLGFVDTDGDDIRNDPKTGENLPELTIMVPSYDPLRIRMGELISGHAEEVGVPIKCLPTEHATMMDLIVVKHEFDMCCWTYGWWPPWDPISLLYHSEQDFPWGWNDPGYHNDTWDALIDDIMATTDYNELLQKIWTFQEWYKEQIPDFPLFERLMIDAYRIEKEGFLSQKGAGVNNPWTYANVRDRGEDFGGIYKFPILQEPKTQNPCLITSGWDSEFLNRIYDPLLAEDLNRDVIPWVAREWEVENLEDGMKVTYNICDNITWHDGDLFTAEDVKFTFEYYRDNKVPTPYPYVKNITRIDTPDDYTVEVYMSIQSYPAFHGLSTQCLLLPKHIWEDKVWDEFINEAPIGSGAFKFFKRVEGEYIHFKYNEDYFRGIERIIPIPTYTLSINSLPVAGVAFTIEGESESTPYLETLETGTYTVTAPTEVTLDTTTYSFVKWVDGPTSATRTVELSEDTTLTIKYEAPTPPPITGYLIGAVVVAAIFGVGIGYGLLRRK